MGLKSKVLTSIIGILVVLCMLVGGYSLYNIKKNSENSLKLYKDTLYTQYDNLIKSQVENAMTTVKYAYDKEQKGQLTESQAKELAKNLVKTLRYGKEGYFWIDNTDYILIAHPVLPKQEGRNRKNETDPKGTKLIQNIIKAAENGNGNNNFTNFLWAKPQDVKSGKLSPKRAYSKLFKPWNWIISTGNYVDNIDSEVQYRKAEIQRNMVRNVMTLLIFILIGIFASILITIYIYRIIVNPVVKIEGVMGSASSGNLAVRIGKGEKGEIGKIYSQFDKMLDSLGELFSKIKESSKILSEKSKVLQDVTSETTSSMSEISSAVEEVAKGSQSQSENLNEANNGVNDLAKSIEEVSYGIEESQKLSESTMNLNKTGMNMMEELIEKTDKTAKVSKDMNSIITKMNKNSEEIGKIVGTITGIAEQTNLLSLNASIESARAGTAGRGFAVVAEEIRKLSEKSNESAVRIQGIIKDIQDNSKIAVNSIKSSSEIIIDESKYIKEIKKIFQNISDAIEKITSNSNDVFKKNQYMIKYKENISKSMLNVNSKVQTFSTNCEEASASLKNMFDYMTKLSEMVKNLMNVSNDLNSQTSKFITK